MKSQFNIITVLILKLIFGLKFNDSYVLNFILIYGYYFQQTSNHNISLAVALINLFASTFVRYMCGKNYKKALIINMVIFSVLIYYHKIISEFINPHVKHIIFFGIGYILLSMSEWIIHKYVMHCNKQSVFFSILSKFDCGGIAEEICDLHIQHHKEVRPNMDMIGVKNKKSLFMGWRVCVEVSIIAFLCFCIAKKISQIKIPYSALLILSIVSSVFWSYLWNKVHPLMHRYNKNYSLKEGPNDRILDFSLINKLFYRNHYFHHIQKGSKKGNYNVIVFGADEWFGTNVQVINNKEYCSNPHSSNEEICKTS